MTNYQNKIFSKHNPIFDVLFMHFTIAFKLKINIHLIKIILDILFTDARSFPFYRFNLGKKDILFLSDQHSEAT